jgi:hypothetical protein
MKANSYDTSAKDTALRSRFKGIKGGELRVDGLVPTGPVALFLENWRMLQQKYVNWGQILIKHSLAKTG